MNKKKRGGREIVDYVDTLVYSPQTRFFFFFIRPTDFYLHAFFQLERDNLSTDCGRQWARVV